jgi:hypothetical protein
MSSKMIFRIQTTCLVAFALLVLLVLLVLTLTKSSISIW